MNCVACQMDSTVWLGEKPRGKKLMWEFAVGLTYAKKRVAISQYTNPLLLEEQLPCSHCACSSSFAAQISELDENLQQSMTTNEPSISSNDNLIGFLLAMLSSAFIGSSFIIKKLGLRRAGASGSRASEFSRINFFDFNFPLQFLGQFLIWGSFNFVSDFCCGVDGVIVLGLIEFCSFDFVEFTCLRSSRSWDFEIPMIWFFSSWRICFIYLANGYNWWL